MFIQAYINTAQEILNAYKGEIPFGSFLKNFFAANKKFGSRDRKNITHLCYCFFRLGKALYSVDVKERMVVGLFLCSLEKNRLLEKIRPEWNDIAGWSMSEKIQKVQGFYPFDVAEIFSLQSHVSAEIDFKKFSIAMLFQPDTYLRLRPGKKIIVEEKLNRANIPFQKINDDCLAVAPATKLEEVLLLNKEAVIQDISSQQVIKPLLAHKSKNDLLTAWDCCAASGGKSILLKDFYPNLQLTVSDVRESILVNLKKRFEQAGIKNYKSHVADVGADNFVQYQTYDLVVCDVPCSGSGTWGRTPEQLYFFEEKKIQHYETLQKKIVSNAAKSLKKASVLLYITCSVFKEENEEAVEFIQQELHLKLVSATYLKGYEQRADTLFAALFTL